MKMFDFSFKIRENYPELPVILNCLNNLIFTQSATGKIEVIDYNYKLKEHKYYIDINVTLNQSNSSIEICRDLEGELSDEYQKNLVDLFYMTQENITYLPFFSLNGKILDVVIYDNPDDIKFNKVINTVETTGNINSNDLLTLCFNLSDNFPELSSIMIEGNKMLRRNASAFISHPTFEDGTPILCLKIFFETKLRPSLTISFELIKSQKEIDFFKFNYACSQIPNNNPISLVKIGKLLKIVVEKSNNNTVQTDIDSMFNTLKDITP